MTTLSDLPAAVLELLRSGVHAQFGTVSSVGVPIDTPMMYFPSEGLRTIDVATGLAYPSKAERARKNPKVGLLIEGTPDEPVISIAGLATVKDTDLQANADRYIAETAFNRLGGAPWPLARNAVWYWTRMIVSITPVRILWWPNPAAMDTAPNGWRAPADTAYPKSDPAPPGKLSESPSWPDRPWQEQAKQSVSLGIPAHLTLCDDEGYPLPIRARSVRQVDDGLVLEIPHGAPWQPAGKATLTFAGLSTFVGAVTSQGQEVHLHVERALPVLPFMTKSTELWEPSPATREAVMGRLTHEAARRSQSIPQVPEVEPEPSPGAKLRIARLAALKQPKQGSQLEAARRAISASE